MNKSGGSKKSSQPFLLLYRQCMKSLKDWPALIVRTLELNQSGELDPRYESIFSPNDV